ncbi:MAG: rhodanese-like domain-containing protein [Acidimicrobiia bacterium]|nr:rhodanese-like domain-containing protein [Acidimicrobiia bacterium]MDX2467466.1 rhodanese-like domain-containing protein [Acidimicrobiia bacterium]
MNMLRRMSLVGLVLAFGLIAAACGGSESTDTTEGTVPPLETTAAPAETTAAPAAETTAAPEETTTTVAAFDLVAAVGEYESTIPEGWMSVGDVAAFKDAVENSGALIIDVREPSEYEAGHMPGAVNISLRTLAASVDKIPADTQVFIYCASGYRAGLATSSLRLMGYDNVLAGPTYAAWTDAGEEVSTEAVEAAVVGDPGLAPELVAAADGWLSTIPEGWQTAGDVEAVKAAVENGAFILDVRTEGEYAEGHIEGAVNIPLRSLTANMDQIPTDVQVIVHCKSGFRAALAMPVLNVLGFGSTKAFTGSYLAWVEAGEPVVTG